MGTSFGVKEINPDSIGVYRRQSRDVLEFIFKHLIVDLLLTYCKEFVKNVLSFFISYILQCFMSVFSRHQFHLNIYQVDSYSLDKL